MHRFCYLRPKQENILLVKKEMLLILVITMNIVWAFTFGSSKSCLILFQTLLDRPKYRKAFTTVSTEYFFSYSNSIHGLNLLLYDVTFVIYVQAVKIPCFFCYMRPTRKAFVFD